MHVMKQLGSGLPPLVAPPPRLPAPFRIIRLTATSLTPSTLLHRSHQPGEEEESGGFMPVTCVSSGGGGGGTRNLSLAQSLVCCDNAAQAFQSRNWKKTESHWCENVASHHSAILLYYYAINMQHIHPK